MFDPPKHEYRGEWLGHEYTKHLLAEMRKRRDTFQKKLEAACQASADPEVREAVARVKMVDDFIETLGRKEKNGSST